MEGWTGEEGGLGGGRGKGSCCCDGALMYMGKATESGRSVGSLSTEK